MTVALTPSVTVQTTLMIIESRAKRVNSAANIKFNALFATSEVNNSRQITIGQYGYYWSTATTAPFISFRKPKNLKDCLVREKLPKDVASPKGMQPCGKSKCQICRFVLGTNVFRDSGSKHTYFINYTFNLK